MATQARSPDAADFFKPEVITDPFEYYRTWTPKQPVVTLPNNSFLVLSYELCVEAGSKHDIFSNDIESKLSGARAEDPEVSAILATGWPQESTLLTADPPRHTHFRKLVNRAFNIRRVRLIEDDMRAIAADLIDGFADAGQCDFVHDFAVPLPVRMIAGQLGFDESAAARVKRWSDAFTDRLGHMIDHERELECARQVVEFQHFAKEKIDERRQNPREDLLSDLVHAHLSGEERPLSDAEILSILQQLMVAGNETTTSALAGGLLHLIRNPDQMARAVQAADDEDDAHITNLVQEVLRIESPTSGMWRLTLADTELGGVHIPKGSMVQLRYAAADLDPAKYPDPERFDIDRDNARTHLAFGTGIHMCPGNMLARREMVIAYQELLRRLTDFQLADGYEPFWPPNMLLRGLTTLPVTFRRRT